MLKGIEMLPARFLEVMSLVQRTAKRARIFRSSAGRQLKLQLGRAALKIKTGRDYLPGWCQTKSQCHDFVSIHRQSYSPFEG